MSDPDHAAGRLKDLLLEAVELPEGERDAFIRRVTQGDDDLHHRLEHLVRAWNDATVVLQSPTRAPLVAARPGDFAPEKPGDRLGPFVLGEKVGEGGFGVVFRARQDAPVRRDLAIKLLKPGMDSAAVLNRFDAERQALARLTHPSIARIYDAGATPAGRPFFAMELVEGEPITEYCDNRRLPIPDRLRLLCRVCHAVQHAHQKGVIHRDLKPSNILVVDVDGEATPKIIDFGIAKAIDEPLTGVSVITLAQQMIGTPRYMSPEQASLDPGAVDTRSDVYSLGVVLYELLCAATPISEEDLRSQGLGALSRVLSEGRFPRPSARAMGSRTPNPDAAARRATTPERLASQLSGDLDWITMRAIDPDPARRYQTALAFGRDIERYLRDEPVDARQPAKAYLARKFIKRHRTGVGVAAVVGVALVGGLAAALWGQRQAAIERDGARAALEEANAATAFLARTLAAADPDGRGRDVRVADLLDEASAQLDADPGPSDATAARLHHVLGNAYRALGDWPNAETRLRQSIASRERGGQGDHPDTLQVRVNLASLLYEQQRLEDALRVSADAIDRMRATLGERDQRTFGAMANHALMLAAAGQTQEAYEIETRVLELTREVLGPDHPRAVGATHNLANSVARMGRDDEAEALFVDALERGRRALGDSAPETDMARESLAVFYHRRGRTDEARPLLERVVQRRREVYGDSHPSTVLAVYNLGSNALLRGEYTDAVEILAGNLAAARATLPPSHPLITATISNLVLAYDQTQCRAADERTTAALIDTIAAFDPGAVSAQDANNFAHILLHAQPESFRDPHRAHAFASAAVGRAETENDQFLYGFLDTLASAMDACGDHAGAVETQERALALTPADAAEARREIEANLARFRAALMASTTGG